MAARKSLNVYAIPEAERGFRKALTMLENAPAVAAPHEAASVVVGLLETMMLKSDYREAGRIADAYMPVVKGAGETPELVIAYYYQTLALVQRYELRAGLERMTEAIAVAEKIGDPRALAFAQAGLLHCRTRLGLDTREEAERRRKQVLESCLSLNDNFLRNSAYFFVVWDCIYRGLLRDARALAIQQIASGEANGDPRAIGFANWILGWINVIADAPSEAIAYADECLRLAIAPLDRLQGENIKTVAAILSGQGRDALPRIEALNRRVRAAWHSLQHSRGAARRRADRDRAHLRRSPRRPARDCRARGGRRPDTRRIRPHSARGNLYPGAEGRPAAPAQGRSAQPADPHGGAAAGRAAGERAHRSGRLESAMGRQ